MQRNRYFEYLEETSVMVNPLIQEQVTQYCKNDPELMEIMSLFYNKRNNKTLLKPTLFRLAYEMCGGKNFEALLPIATSFEVLNISSYQANASFDNKVGILSKEEKDSQFIGSMVSREIADNLIDISSHLNKETILKIKRCISKSNCFIYKAQHYDLNLLSLHNIEQFCNYEKYLKAYITRCFYGSGIFSGQCALAGAIAADATIEMQSALMKFGEYYGTALHEVNDLADYFPGQERKSKLYQDNFCDFNNGRLTLPLYLLIKNTDIDTQAKIREIQQKKIKTAQDFNVLQTILRENGFTDKCKKLAKSNISLAKDAIETFELTEAKRLILALLSVLDSNKFYHRINM